MIKKLDFSSAVFRACLVIFVSLIASNSALAQELSWNDVTDLSVAGQPASGPQIVLSSDGTKTTVVWERYDGSNTIIQSRSATISENTASWGAVTDLTAAGQYASRSKIALSSDGTKATAIWYRSDGSNNIIQSRSATITGNTASWGAVTDLSDAGKNAYTPQIALSSDGTKVTAVWGLFDGSSIIQSRSATISENTASWGAVTNLTTAGQPANGPEITFSSDGTKATAVWYYRSDGSNNIIQSRSATITGNTASWGAVTDLSVAGKNASRSQIALSSDGTKSTAVWFRYDGSNNIIQSRSATITGNTASWGAVIDLSAAGQTAEGSQIALSSDGAKATAVWYRRYDGFKFTVQSRSATISGIAASWGAVTDLSATGQTAEDSQIALSSDGTKATAIWYRYDGSKFIIQSAYATISGNMATWGGVTDLSATGQTAEYYDEGPQIALSSDGAKVTAIWERNDGSSNIIQSRSASIEEYTCYVNKAGNGKTFTFCL